MSDRPSPKRVSLSEQLKKLSPEKRALLDLMSNRTTIKGCQLVAQALLANGVTHIYAVSGIPVQELLAVAVDTGIRVIGAHHQQAAVLMATAHNYVAGKINAIAIISAGPAVTNVATGLLVARDNAWPVIVLGGRRHGVIGGQDNFQELDAAELYKSITKWTACIGENADIQRIINEAFEVATTGRPGPVYLDIMEDVLLMQCTSSSTETLPNPTAEIAIKQDDVEQAAALLCNARQPAFILGKGTRWSLAPVDLVGLIEQHQIACISSPMGRGIIPDEHPLCFNDAKAQLQATADVVLVLGARLNWTFRFGNQINPHAKIIQIDIDPDEVKKNEKICLGIVADVGDFFARLRASLNAQPGKELLTCRELWHESLTVARQRHRTVVEERSMSDRLPMSSYRLMSELKESLPADAILIADGNISMMAVQHVIPGQTPFSRFTAGTNGCMGVGVPFGIGARLGDPSRHVVVISGDMAFGISGMELETAVRCAAPVIVVVVNNEGLSGGNIQRKFYPEDYDRVTMFEPDIRYEKIAEAFGANGEYVDHPEQLRPAMERALKSDKPTCINVKVDPYEEYMSEL
jgi:2-hydroxyacyl-CoA lyase 1